MQDDATAVQELKDAARDAERSVMMLLEMGLSVPEILQMINEEPGLVGVFENGAIKIYRRENVQA